MKKVCLIILGLLLFLTACQSIKNPDDVDAGDASLKTATSEKADGVLGFEKKPLLDSSFILRLNEEENEVYLPGNIAVKLTTIKDYRCPIGVECVRAGEVLVVLEIDYVGEDPFEVTLSLGDDIENHPRFTVLDGNTHLTLQSVVPTTHIDESVKPEDQTVTLSVTRHAVE